MFDITVACSEAMANAIEHSPVKGEVQVRTVLWPDRLEVEVQGPGEFQAPDRLKKRESRGLGLPLMAKFSDHLALFSGPAGQTFVSLTFYLPGRQPKDQDAVPPSFRNLSEEDRLLDDVLRNLPDGAVEGLDLKDIIEPPGIQSLLDDFYRLAGIPLAIIDLTGRVLVGAGWADICTRFHRVNPETCRNCIESDTVLTTGVPEGEFKLYKCENHMWDVATPIMVGGAHVGNIFSGQFFFENEVIDRDLFRAQAKRYGFDEDTYLAALDAVPRLSRDSLGTGMSFFVKLARLLSDEGYARIKLARALAQREVFTESLRQAHEQLQVTAEELAAQEEESREAAHFYRQTLESIPGMVFTTRPDGYCDYQSQQWVDYTGVPMSEHVGDGWNRAASPRRSAAGLRGLARAVEGEAPYDLEYRVRRHDGQYEWFKVLGRPIRDADGQIVRWFGVATNIEALKRAEKALRESEERYHALAVENERLYRQQLDIAEHLQLALLNIPSEIGPLRLGHLYRSATEAARVGGDFYDVFELKDGKVVLLVGDVSGHGIQAARTATFVKDVVHAFAHQSVRPHEVVESTNTLLVEKDLPGFVTLFLGILDTETGTLRYVSAGHPETFLRRTSGEPQLLGSGSSPLGIFPDASWKPGIVHLEPGDLLLLYTDGVLEARRNGELFGLKRLESVLKRKRLSVERLPHAVLDEVLAFSGGRLRDDVAVLAVLIAGKMEAKPGAFTQEKPLE